VKLTVAYLTRNCKDELKKSIDSIYSIADEIVCLDSNSTDGTVEYLKTLDKAKIFNYDAELINGGGITLIKDFSKARNELIKLCSGDWILMLDSDEWFDEYNLNRLKGLFETHPEVDVWELIQYSLTSSEAYISCPTLRLFRNNGKAYYSRSVHETLQESVVANKLKFGKTDIRFEHSGYSDKERNFKKQNKVLETISDDHPMYDYYKALGLMAIGNVEDSMPYFKNIISPESKYSDYTKAYIFNVLAELRYGQNNIYKAIIFAKHSLKLVPEQNLAYSVLVNCYLRVNALDEAINMLEKLKDRTGKKLCNIINDQHFDRTKLIEFINELKETQKKDLENLLKGEL